MAKSNAGRDRIRQGLKANLARPMTKNEKELARMDTKADPLDSRTAATVAPNTIECPSCLGTGEVDPGEYEPAPCPECHGKCRVPRCPMCADLLAALKALMGDIDSGLLVRDISRDNDPGWTMRMFEFVRRLAAAQAAIAKAEG